jgi:hypothetical protein
MGACCNKKDNPVAVDGDYSKKTSIKVNISRDEDKTADITNNIENEDKIFKGEDLLFHGDINNEKIRNVYHSMRELSPITIDTIGIKKRKIRVRRKKHFYKFSEMKNIIGDQMGKIKIEESNKENKLGDNKEDEITDYKEKQLLEAQTGPGTPYNFDAINENEKELIRELLTEDQKNFILNCLEEEQIITEEMGHDTM